MTNSRAIIFFWILLLVPTIIIAGTTFTLLTHEQERINQSFLTALKDRAAVIGDNIHTSIETIQRNLTRSLLSIPEDRLPETLGLWKQSNPLIRNIFIWNEQEGIIHPVQGMESTQEERRFLIRYDALFSGQMPWKYSTLHTANNSNFPEVATSELRAVETTGWLPWFSENRLFILGWVRAADQSTIYGVELELMAIISRLLPHLPAWRVKNAAYGILNGNGELLHQSGQLSINLQQEPHALQAVSPLLPHWQISIHLNGDALESPTSFMVMSGLLLLIFIISIVSGAALITWQAHIHRKDALEKTSFVSSVSHELKTPLTSIRMYAELLHSGRVRAPEKTARYLNVIVAESQRLTRLVNNVLDFGRLEQDRKKYHKISFDLGDFLRDIADTHSIRLRESGMETKMLIPDTPMIVNSDPDALEQVVLNIVDNAIKYASLGKQVGFSLMQPEDHGKGKKRCKKSYFTIFFPFMKILLNSKKSGMIIDETQCRYYEIKISDRGPGIAKKERKKVFEKFHRVDHSLTARQPGSGLGLSIARKIARDLGGDLLLKAPPEGGCCFIIKVMANYKKYGEKKICVQHTFL